MCPGASGSQTRLGIAEVTCSAVAGRDDEAAARQSGKAEGEHGFPWRCARMERESGTARAPGTTQVQVSQRHGAPI
ncbi:MAG: hypothetical protein CFH37_01230 [Alphaproteobacteria bacterium MarineAlpha9_Bin7]|nr:MAG: hypothetical protein CFH37_01230 [Alphaproteobacteria bacterium MarineAlpha9_Bin7]